MFSSSEYSQDELEAHREAVHREGTGSGLLLIERINFKNTSEEQHDFSPASLRSDNTMESSDLNYNLLNENDPCLSDALPQHQELKEINDFVQEIFSELEPVSEHQIEKFLDPLWRFAAWQEASAHHLAYHRTS